MEKMKENKDIIMKDEDWRDFKTATKCFICGEGLQGRRQKV